MFRPTAESDGLMGELVGFAVRFAVDVKDREIKGAGQFATRPVERVQPWAAACVFAGHLADYHLRVGENVQHLSFQFQSMLQSFEQGDIFGNIVVLVPNPLRDPDLPALRILKHDANPGRSGTAMGTTINVCNKN